MTKKIKIILIVVCIALAFHFIFKKKTKHAPSMQPILVEVTKVTRGNIAEQVQAIGTLTAKTIQITPEISGHVAKILFKDGAFVKEGSLLIQLEDSASKAKYEADQAALFYSQTNYHRMVLLGKKGAIAQQAIDQALADLKEKEATASLSKIAWEKMRLIAPFEGVVGQCKVNPGDFVSQGLPLVSLTDKEHLRVEYSVPEEVLAKIKLNQPVKVTSSVFPGQEFLGNVTYISPAINIDNRTISLYADLPNPNNVLAPGLFVNVTQLMGMENNALLISPNSLVPTIDGQLVFRVENNKAQAVAVQVRQRTATEVQVLGNLSLNDRIVIVGQSKLKDGATVQIRGQG